MGRVYILQHHLFSSCIASSNLLYQFFKIFHFDKSRSINYSQFTLFLIEIITLAFNQVEI